MVETIITTLFRVLLKSTPSDTFKIHNTNIEKELKGKVDNINKKRSVHIINQRMWKFKKMRQSHCVSIKV